jgi:hypothetical protein
MKLNIMAISIITINTATLNRLTNGTTILNCEKNGQLRDAIEHIKLCVIMMNVVEPTT